MKPNETEILQLREMVEESVSRKMKTPADFQFLTGVIQERCKAVQFVGIGHNGGKSTQITNMR